MQFEIKIKNLDEFRKMFKRAPELVNRELDEALVRVSVWGESRAVLNLNHSSFKYQVNDTGYLAKQIRKKKIGNLSYAIVSGASYSQFIEDGRRAGVLPNIGSLREWVYRHRSRFGVKNNKEVDGITFVIGRKIKNKGVKARPYMKLTFEEMQGVADKEFDRALNNVINKL